MPSRSVLLSSADAAHGDRARFDDEAAHAAGGTKRLEERCVLRAETIGVVGFATARRA